jgi:uncharacterized protein (TIGR03000 family)
MSRLRFALVAAAALVIPLLAVGKSSAHWRGGGWGGYAGGYGYYSPWSGSGWYGTGPYYSYSPYYSPYYRGSYYTTPFYSGSYNTTPYYGSSAFNTPGMYAAPMTYGGGYASTTGTPGGYTSGSTTTQAFYPPGTTGDMRALVDVMVPADAQVWFDGESTSQRGTDRLFRSPPLESGQNYSYEVKASWTESGKQVEQTRKVRVRPGERVQVNFLAPEEGARDQTRPGS